MTGLHQHVRRTLLRHGLLPAGSTTLVAVSGGSDSVALTCLLCELQESLGFRVAGIAHVNHGLRATADRDEAFCREFAARHQLGCVVERADVSGYAASQRLSIEEAARRLRYDSLERAAAQLPADRIAVGHTSDDQAETVLLKLIRGAGAVGASGIYPRRGRIVRPLLDVERSELRAYLSGRGEAWVEDETNDDLANPRNRIRHLVIPELERAYGGRVRRSIARTAALVREDGAWLDDESERIAEEVTVRTPDSVELDVARLGRLPPPIVRRVLRKALRAVAGGREVGHDHVMAATDVLTGACGGTDVPGGRVDLRAGKLVLSPQRPTPR